ncbi:MAG: DUF58 domain-containing protein [Verrucomicrobiales bacterium]|nr:DUF58 domain-containing protein [Verrucomicrobiales bacterium]
MASTLRELDYMRLLPDETASMLARLELLARAKKQGSKSGKHTSPNKGFSVVFAEHRQYSPGDDIRDLDWRVYGKSNRYYIKQYIEETNLRATIVLDASGSMNFRGDLADSIGGEKLTKFEYGQYLAAALAYLMIRQQDAVGLVTFDERVRASIRAASRPSQVRLILEEIHRTECAGDTRLAATLHEVAERIPSRGLVVLISDMFDKADAIVEAFHHFAFKSHELVLFHLMAEEELTFPFKTSQEFRDLEPTSLKLKVDPQTIRSTYLQKVREHVAKLEKACGQLRADYIPVTTKQPYTRALADFLGRRAFQQR